MSTRAEYPHRDLTHGIIGAFFRVHRVLGSGFHERVYQRALRLALEDRGLRVQLEVPLRVWFGHRVVGRFRADAVVEDSVALELKALPELTSAHQSQLLNVLRATRLELGLLLNFGPRPEVKRLILSHGSMGFKGALARGEPPR